METCSAQPGGLNASASAVGPNIWHVALLRSVIFRLLGDKTSSFLFPLALPPLTQVLPPT